MRLSDYAVGRDNNFNLLRLLAALSVIFSHSVGVLAVPHAEIFFERLGMSLGEMAVDVFFVTSGFLVTGSLMTRKNLIAFLWARALRIYPALWVMLALTVFVLAPAVTTLSVADYFRSPVPYEYAWKCGTLIGGVRYYLPGVFQDMPLKGEVNGSLWTLPIEMRMYLYLAGSWFVLAALPSVRVRAMTVLAPIATAALLVFVLSGRLSGGPFNAANIRVFMFMAGATMYLWRDKISLNGALLAALIAVLALASFDKRAYFVAYVLCLPLLVIHLAYLPKGRFRAVNEWGDFSYGTYIYAFPIQQTLAFLIPGISLFAMTTTSAVATLAVAALSWRLIERRALGLKAEFAAVTSRAFEHGLARLGYAPAGSAKF